MDKLDLSGTATQKWHKNVKLINKFKFILKNKNKNLFIYSGHKNKF
jgi:hypothetical protein